MKPKDKVCISVRFTEEESDKLAACAELCGLSQAEFVRQLCRGRTPKPQPTQELWELLDTLYLIHSDFKECAKFEPAISEICGEIEQMILAFQEVG